MSTNYSLHQQDRKKYSRIKHSTGRFLFTPERQERIINMMYKILIKILVSQADMSERCQAEGIPKVKYSDEGR